MDKFRIDGHKLLYHVGRVSEWLQGENVYPIYIETSPSGACNHRCRFCGKDFMKYQRRFLDWDMFKQRLEEMGRLGVKSIMHAGEGEPLLHKNIVEIVQTGKAAGIDQALNTNGVLFTSDKAEGILPYSEWVRISLDAGTRDTYAHLHRTQPGDFDRVLENLTEANRLRKANKWTCALGIQMLLLPENRQEVVTLAEKARDTGVDYLVIKPYSQHPQSFTTEYHDVTYEEDLALAEKLEPFSTPDFNVIFRVRAMRKWDTSARSYARCYAMSFWTYIDAAGIVWGCCNHLGEEAFRMGNLYENTFEEIWNGEQRRSVIAWVQNEMDAYQCRINCRMDEVNRYLWDLRNPPGHVNFI